jgi:hypothetical protein
MITQEYLNSEIDLAVRIYLYYQEKMEQFIQIGSDDYLVWYKDLCVLFFLTKSLLSIQMVDNLLYSGSAEVTEDDLLKITGSVREYLTYELKSIVYSELDTDGNVTNPTVPGAPVTTITYTTFTQDWRSCIVVVPADDVQILTIPFDSDLTDPDATRVTVNDNDPISLSSPLEEGCHLSGTTLYWHTYYNLKAGDRVFIQYLMNNTSTGATIMGNYIEVSLKTDTAYQDILAWYQQSFTGDGMYTVATPTYPGYSYIYLSIPNNKSFSVKDSIGTTITSEFVLVGTRTISTGVVNNIYRKTNQYDTTSSINLTVTLF